ncbi:MAG TPA: M2 family metallopeptidase, partial [Kofleriaceae bacterium]|nr:M2 family metallopeptidase [Kofleriaceae bacterium]
MRKTILLAVLTLAAACGKSKPEPPPTKTEPAPGTMAKPAPSADDALIAEAKKFVADTDQTVRKLSVDASQAQWTNETDLTPEHEAATAKASEALSVEVTRLVKTARKFEPVLARLDPDTRRQLTLLKFQAQPSPD